MDSFKLNMVKARWIENSLIPTFLRLEARSSNFSISAWSDVDSEPAADETVSNALAFMKIKNRLVSVVGFNWKQHNVPH